MKSRQTIRRENKINNKHQAGAMVRFSSLHSSSSTVSLTGWMEMILSSQRWPLSFATVIIELTADWHPSHCMNGLPLRSLSGNEPHWNPVVLNFCSSAFSFISDMAVDGSDQKLVLISCLGPVLPCVWNFVWLLCDELATRPGSNLRMHNNRWD